MLRLRDEHINPSRSRTLRLFRHFVPMTDAYHGQRFLIRRDGVLLATPLLAVLVLVEVTDVVFAVDSIPAIFAVTDEPFLVFTANAFAILGLRAMYFLLADLIHRFVYLKAGLALVLMWVGVKMLLKIDVYYIPTTVSLAVIATILGVSIAASLRATRGQGRRALQAPAAAPFRIASEDEVAELEPVRRRRRHPAGAAR
jgi:tellurite resistance protein TerC